MEPGGSIPHSPGLSNNPYPERNQPKSSYWYLFLQILKAFLPSLILATWPSHLNLLDLITLTILVEWYKLWSSSLWSLLHSPFSSLLGPNIRVREGRSAFKILTGKPTGKRPLGRSRRRWDDNIRMDLDEIRIIAGNLVDLAQDRDYWRALVNAIVNLLFP